MVTTSATFGRPMLAEWGLEPGLTYLNHGTVGSVPRRVLAAQSRLRDEIELNPSRFLLRELASVRAGLPREDKPRMRVAAESVAAFLGVRGDDLAFVENVSTGINAVLRSLEFQPGDEILVNNLSYGAVTFAARYVAQRAGAEVRVVELPFPATQQGFVDAYAAAITPRTRLAIVDHITSESALLFPLADIAAACRARGVPVLADGAHAPGAIPLDIDSLGVDWYAANLHKWAWSPRSCGILWAPPGRQADLHPLVIYWGYGMGFTDEFDLVGTRDPSPFLAAPEGLAFMQELGVDAVLAHNHDLQREAAAYLARRWDVEIGSPDAMRATMVTVPLPPRAGSTRTDADRLRDALLFEDHIEVQMHAWRERVWVRISAQVYNDMADVERLRDAVDRRLPA